MTEQQRIYDYQRRVKGLNSLQRLEMAAYVVASTCMTPQGASLDLQEEIAALADAAIESWKGNGADFQATVAAEVLFRLHHNFRRQINAARMVEGTGNE